MLLQHMQLLGAALLIFAALAHRTVSCNISNCTQCDGLYCLECEQGFYLYRDQACIACSPHCQICNESACLQCSPDYPNIVHTHHCSRCTDLQSCMECDSDGEVCNECLPGMYADSEGTCSRLCRNCVDCEDNECVVCRPGYYISTSGDCTPCDPSCILCSVSDVCDLCPPGRYSLPGQPECFSCEQNCMRCVLFDECYECMPGYEMRQNHRCVAASCPTSCEDCRSDGSCRQCQEGFYLPDCEPCASGCISCPDASLCSDCMIGYGLNTVGTCVECSTSNCRYCDIGGICQECVEGFHIHDDNTCTDCPVGCSDCTSEYCNNCVIGYYWERDVCLPCSTSYCADCYMGTCYRCSEGMELHNGLCVACPPGCSRCSEEGLCHECQPDFWKTETDACTACPSVHGCESCTDGSSCDVCLYGFYPSTSEVGLCLECMSECASCSNDDSCDECRQLDKYWDTEQSGCIPCPGACAVCSTYEYCERCISGYYSLASGGCEECSPPCKECSDIDTCTACERGMFLEGTQCLVIDCAQGCEFCTAYSACILCAPGYYMHGGVCIACMQNCEICDALGCHWCEPGYYLEPSDHCAACTTVGCKYCNQGSCYACMPGYVLRNEECIACSATNCVECSPDDVSVCLQCAEGYGLDGHNQCIGCPENCIRCGNHECRTCAQGYGKNKSGLCMECQPGCQICSSYGSCYNCYPEYVWADYNACTLCPSVDGCAECSDRSYCDECLDGYYMSAEEHGRCLSCMDNCVECENPDSCLECRHGNYWSDVNLQCQGCGPYCSFCSSADQCDVCRYGYYLDTSSGCEECPDPCKHCSSETECLVCEQGYYLTDTNTCEQCGSNCTACYSAELCSSCESGFVSVHGVCEACTVSHCDRCHHEDVSFCHYCMDGFFMNDYHECTECHIENCEYCYSQYYCGSCSPGYRVYHNWGLCIACGEHCLGCYDGYCYRCEDGYELSNHGYQYCTACPHIDGCDLCTDGAVCDQCSNGYYSTETGCSSCNVNCLSCTHFDDCTECAPGYFWLPDELRCAACPHQCASCSSLDQCDTCDAEHYWEDELLECVPCPHRCQRCSGPEQCDDCLHDLYWDPAQHTCTWCSVHNCYTCTHDGSCTKCHVGYDLIDDTCIESDMHCHVEFCIDCFGTECHQCASGYHLDINNTCTRCSRYCADCGWWGCDRCIEGYFRAWGEEEDCLECLIDNCSLCTERNCAMCMPGFYLDGFSCLPCSVDNCESCPRDDLCIRCLPGYFLVNNTCEACISGCDSCFDDGTCDECLPGYDRVGDVCESCNAEHCALCNTPDVCNQCAQGYYLVSPTSCQECSPQCTQCVDDTQCTQCNEGYFLTPEAQCNDCGTGCSFCEADSACEQCEDGLQLVDGVCVDCRPVDYCRHCDQSGGCLQCIDGFYVTDTNTCERCGDGCWQCASAEQCIHCMEGYRITTDDLCVVCPSNCESCDESVCYHCQTGYYTDDTGSCKPCSDDCATCDEPNRCTSCGDGLQYNDVEGTCTQCRVENCRYCKSSICDECLDGYLHENNQCLECPHGCDVCESSDRCLWCRREFAILTEIGEFEEMECIECDDGCTDCIIPSHCTGCTDGYVLDEYTHTCIECEISNCMVCTAANVCQRCMPGYQLTGDRSTCQDIIECDESACIHGECENTEGGFECACHYGFKDTFCQTDINQCDIMDTCEHGTCVNKEGGFDCDCEEGYSGRFCEIRCIDNCITCKNDYRCQVCAEDYRKENGTCHEISKARLYPWGPSGDRWRYMELWAWWDNSQDCYWIDEGNMFNFYGTNYDTICVSRHGYLTFGWPPYTGGSNPEHMNASKPHPIIAPLNVYFTHNSSRDDYSQVYISFYDHINEAEAAPARDAKVLDLCKEDYADLGNDPEFNPTFAMVVTYDRMKTHPYRENRQEATFQVILCQDSKTRKSSVQFRYGHIHIRQQVPNAVGMQVPGQPEYTFNHPLAGTKEMYNVNELPGNVISANHPTSVGEYFYKTSRPEDENQFFAPYECQNWYAQQDLSLMWQVSAALPTCPCNFWSVELFPNFVPTYPCAYSTDNLPATRQCCYGISRRGWWWVLEDHVLGTGHMVQHNPLVDYDSYHFSDELPRQWCCSQSRWSCWMYERARPQSRCGDDNWMPFWGWFFGDPHVYTLDGLVYVFNGFGEYVFLDSDDLEIQMRTTAVLNAEGEAVGATIFTAGVMKAPGTSKVQVEVGDDGETLVINTYPGPPDGQDLTAWYATASTNDMIIYENMLLTLVKKNETLAIKFSESDIEVTARVGSARDLVLAIGANQVLIDQPTRGLMGNINGDPNDDFLRPDGTTLLASSDEQTIYNEFGQLWLVNQDDTRPSLFEYPEGMTTVHFQAPESYFPRFNVFDDLTSEQQAELRNMCGDDIACQYDYVLTGDEDLASASGGVSETAQDITNSLDNTVPSLSLDHGTTVNMTVGQEAEVVVTVIDSADDTFTFTNILPDDGSFSVDGDTGTFTWTPANTNPVYGLSFSGFDLHDVKAATVVAKIRLCDCSDQGDCDFGRIQLDSVGENDTFVLVRCNCTTGWSGNHCEIDRDACADNPCMPGLDCTDLSPDDEQAMGRGFTCSECPDGYYEEGGVCADIDECEEEGGSSLCQPVDIATCDNEIPGYVCVCGEGYQLSDSDPHLCVDMDECESLQHACQQNCENLIGGYTCSCNAGYILQNDQRTCLPDPDAETPCQRDRDCSDFCADENSCGCRDGRVLGDDQETCIDIDECDSSTPTHMCDDNSFCHNEQPGYRCECNDGYTLNDDGRTCTVCSEGLWGPECGSVCTCASPDTECDPSTGCAACSAGWTGGSCTVDVNECTDDPTLCGDYGTCMNTDGEYTCSCNHGYMWERMNDCVFVDYCADTTTRTCYNGGTCNPIVGGFTCDCLEGFEGDQCEIDINECASNPCYHDALCSDQHGRFACICGLGFAGTLCDEDLDECMSDPCLNGGQCNNLFGQFHCRCPDEWNGSRCQYTNACLTSPCQNGGICTSVAGEYSCQCPTGWVGSECQTNVDECRLHTTPCTHICTDTQGSYECSCHPGSELLSDGFTCESNDECLPNGVICDLVNGYCIDGVACGCNTGFTLGNGNTCVDVNECALRTDSCDVNSDCVNQDPGYKCDCHDGYVLQADRRTCSMENYCLRETPVNKCPHGGLCVPQLRSFTCECPDGYTGLNCETEIDECLSSPCRNGGSCRDGVNKFSCICATGYLGTKCEQEYDECESDPCIHGRCNDEVGTYSCVCYTGYTGEYCEADLNECENSPCGLHGSCVDEIGGYSCRCDREYGGPYCSNKPCEDTPCQNDGYCYVTSSDNYYSCECGAKYTGDNCEIELDVADIPSYTLKSSIRFTLDFTSDLKDVKSPAYKQLTKKIRAAVRRILLRSSVSSYFIDADNFEYIRGSIIASYDVLMKENSTVTENDIAVMIQDTVDDNNGVIPGLEEYPVEEVIKLESSHSSSNNTLVITLSVVIPVAVLILIAMVILVICCGKKHQTVQTTSTGAPAYVSPDRDITESPLYSSRPSSASTIFNVDIAHSFDLRKTSILVPSHKKPADLDTFRSMSPDTLDMKNVSDRPASRTTITSRQCIDSSDLLPASTAGSRATLGSAGSRRPSATPNNDLSIIN